MPDAQHVQVNFAGAVNAQAPAHLIPEDAVQTATNIDFSLEPGGLAVRRGSVQLIASPFNLLGVFRNYQVSIQASTLYSTFQDVAGGTLGVLRGTGDNVTIGTSSGLAPIIQGGFTSTLVGYGKYKDFTYIAANPIYVKDDGTATTEWIKQVPPAPTVVINTETALALGNGQYTAVEGAAGGNGTVTVDGTTLRATLDFNGIGGTSGFADLTKNAGIPIGQLGVHYVDLAFSNPSLVSILYFDFSVGDSNFNSYYRGAYAPPANASTQDNAGLPVATPSIDTLINAQLNVGTSTTTSITADLKAQLAAIISQINLPPYTTISDQKNKFGALGIDRPSFQFIGPYKPPAGVDPWSQIGGIRVTCVALGTGVVMMLQNPRIEGDEGHPLTDPNVGYAWWQTWATLNSAGQVIGESAPSPASLRRHCQQANATVSGTATATGSIHGITHVITYRQGGYMNDAYAVNTAVYNTSTGGGTFVDQMTDIQALSENDLMLRDITSPGQFPGDANILCEESWYDSLWLGHDNVLMWTLPGRPDCFPRTSVVNVSNAGDNLQGIVVWAPQLVVVNRDSVFEMHGSVFSGDNQDWVLQRTGARKGSIAPRTVIKTPYGIPLLNWDGISMYIPGQGVDINLEWVTDQIGDAFRGTDPTDPSRLKGTRIPALNDHINEASAAYTEGKLYITCATGSATVANSVFVIDLAHKKCWYYEYPEINNLNQVYWDFPHNAILLAGFSGIYQIEKGNTDFFSVGQPGTGIPWSAKSRAWTTPQDMIMENLSLEYIGGPATAAFDLDGTATNTIGMFQSSHKTYTAPTYGGSIGNNLTVLLSGTSTGPTSIYGITWDSIVEPRRVSYWRDDFYNNQYGGDKIWDDVKLDLGGLDITNTFYGAEIVAVTFVDAQAVMTNTIFATSITDAAYAQRNTYTFSFPDETYGAIAYTTLTALPVVTTTGTTTFTTTYDFKLWGISYKCRNEPDIITNFVSDRVSEAGEHRWDYLEVEMNPGGNTIVGTAHVDTTAVATFTFTGSIRENFVRSLPDETYGRTRWAAYRVLTTGSGGTGTIIGV